LFLILFLSYSMFWHSIPVFPCCTHRFPVFQSNSLCSVPNAMYSTCIYRPPPCTIFEISKYRLWLWSHCLFNLTLKLNSALWNSVQFQFHYWNSVPTSESCICSYFGFQSRLYSIGFHTRFPILAYSYLYAQSLIGYARSGLSSEPLVMLSEILRHVIVVVRCSAQAEAEFQNPLVFPIPVE